MVAVSTSRARRALMQLRHEYYRSVAPHRNVRRRSADDPAYDLDGWVDAVAGASPPTRVVVLAAGPSASSYQPEEGDLVVATNSSQALAASVPYAYFLSEGFHVDRYLKRGPDWPTCRGVFFRLAAAGLPEVQTGVARRVLGYRDRFVRPVPELFASDLHERGPERDAFDGLNVAIRSLLGENLKQYNSGFGATYLGFYLASRWGASLWLYGLDAGVSGQAHFDGTTMQSPSVVGDRVRRKLSALYEVLQRQDHVAVTNRSAYEPF